MWPDLKYEHSIAGVLFYPDERIELTPSSVADEEQDPTNVALARPWDPPNPNWRVEWRKYAIQLDDEQRYEHYYRRRLAVLRRELTSAQHSVDFFQLELDTTEANYAKTMEELWERDDDYWVYYGLDSRQQEQETSMNSDAVTLTASQQDTPETLCEEYDEGSDSDHEKTTEDAGESDSPANQDVSSDVVSTQDAMASATPVETQDVDLHPEKEESDFQEARRTAPTEADGHQTEEPSAHPSDKKYDLWRNCIEVISRTVGDLVGLEDDIFDQDRRSAIVELRNNVANLEVNYPQQTDDEMYPVAFAIPSWYLPQAVEDHLSDEAHRAESCSDTEVAPEVERATEAASRLIKQIRHRYMDINEARRDIKYIIFALNHIYIATSALADLINSIATDPEDFSAEALFRRTDTDTIILRSAVVHRVNMFYELYHMWTGESLLGYKGTEFGKAAIMWRLGRLECNSPYFLNVIRNHNSHSRAWTSEVEPVKEAEMIEWVRECFPSYRQVLLEALEEVCESIPYLVQRQIADMVDLAFQKKRKLKWEEQEKRLREETRTMGDW